VIAAVVFCNVISSPLFSDVAGKPPAQCSQISHQNRNFTATCMIRDAPALVTRAEIAAQDIATRIIELRRIKNGESMVWKESSRFCELKVPRQHRIPVVDTGPMKGAALRIANLSVENPDVFKSWHGFVKMCPPRKIS
jgi:hypothetical protein